MEKYWIDVIQVSTQIITTIIACLMAYFAWNTYLKEPTQESEPEEPEDRDADVSRVTTLTVFDTSKQTTTLKATSDGLKCFLKNKKKNQELLQWSMPKEEAGFYYSNRRYHVYPGYKANTGTFSIGPRRNWLYSKQLFPEAIYLEDEIRAILRSGAGISKA